MQESVKPAQVDKGTVISDVLDDAFDDRALLEFLEELLFHLLAALFQNGPAGDDNIIAFLIMFKNTEFVAFTNQLVEITNRLEIDLGAR